MANEAYRAVFLRVHPTGKMVLSLTTEPDGNEGRTRRSWPRSSASRRSTSRSCRPTRTASAPATGSTRARRTARPARSSKATGKIRAKAQLLAGVALDAAPDDAAVGQRRVRERGGRGAAQTIADIALYAHGTGALPPGVEGGLDAQTVYAGLTAGDGDPTRHLHPRPADGTLTVRTGKAGAAAKAGHNLVIEVTRWERDAGGRRGAAAASRSRPTRARCAVRSGTGGMGSLGDEEKASIAQSIDDDVLKGGDDRVPLERRRRPAPRRAARPGRPRPARRRRARSRSTSTPATTAA